MSPETSLLLKERLQRWLREEGWLLEEVSGPDFSWSFAAKNPSGVVMNVAQPAGRADQFIVRVGCNIEGAQGHLEKLTQGEQEDLMWDLRLELLRNQVEFEGIQLPLQNVSIYRTGYLDGLDKNKFIELVGCVLRGVTALVWTLTRKFGEGVPPGSEWIH